MNTPETINIEKYANALNNLVGMDIGYLDNSDENVNAIVEVIRAAKALEDRVKDLTIELKAMRGAANSYKIHNKALTEENEYLKQQNEIYEVLNKNMERICESYAFQYGTAVPKEMFLRKERERTVREMQTMIKEECIAGGIYPVLVARAIEKVGKKLLEETCDE